MKIQRAPKATHTTEIRFLTTEEKDKAPDFEAKPGATTVLYGEGKCLICCGLGERRKCAPQTVRRAAAKGIQRAIELKRKKVSVVTPEAGVDEKAVSLACIEGLALGAYRFSKYLSEKPHAIELCQVTGNKLTQSAFDRALAVCEAVNYARDLVNENAGTVTPEYLATEARSLAHGGMMKVTVLDEGRLEREGLGLLLAVGKGSPAPPRLILMEYTGAPRTKERCAVVGKGITFDTGGINLKPSGHLETMRMDMAGAAAVLGLMRVLAKTRPAVNVAGVVAAAYNAIDGTSYFPGDISTSYLGKTVEICNTDAEGRLALADAAAYVNKHYSPSAIIDLATLTGGILTALGSTVAGLFSNDDALAERLFEAGEDTWERLWRFPMYEEYTEAMKGDRSDLRNLPKMPRGHAGSITGAAFIQEFVGKTPWAHIDIAGTAFNDESAKGEIPQYATGFGVRLLARFLGII
jgi:leucyl aminopeptidase